MMNLTINLLPADKKSRVDYTINFIFIKETLKLITLAAAILATSLVWVWIYLQKDFVTLAINSTAISRETRPYNQDIQVINDLTKNINLSNQNFLPVTPKLKTLISSLPNDIKISSLQMDLQTKTLYINGTALTRAALLNYQDILSKIPWLSQVEIPASELFQKINLNFEFKANLENFPLQNTVLTPKQNPIVLNNK